ncbi:MAG: VanZ family protein [Lachnospiraceae bacterium]|nr:VanZ family protein [Lachnospiraceae bacterium]
MIWLNSIVEGVKIFGAYVLPVYLIGSITVMIITKRYNVVKSILQVIFLFYLCCMAGLVFLPLPTLEEMEGLSYQAQLIPLYCIWDILGNPVNATIVLLFNIAMTVPFGMFLRYYFGLNARRVLLYSLALTTLIEIAQYTGLFFLFHGSYRLFDVDDLLSNTLGGMIGYYLVGKLDFLLPNLALFDGSFVRRKPVIVKAA